MTFAAVIFQILANKRTVEKIKSVYTSLHFMMHAFFHHVNFFLRNSSNFSNFQNRFPDYLLLTIFLFYFPTSIYYRIT
jgi:hypothetical protein